MYLEAHTDFHAHLVKELKHHKGEELPTPKSFKEAISGDFAKWWLEAIAKEIENINSHEVAKWVKAPPKVRLLGAKWVFRWKLNAQGQVDRAKARLVCKRYRQLYGVDYLDSMSPVCKLSAFRVCVAECAARGMNTMVLDIRSAYLQAKLDHVQYMRAPEGVKPPKPGMVWKVSKGLYGMVPSGRCWHLQFRGELIDWKYRASTVDTCVFVRWLNNSVIRIVLFVDMT